MEPTQSSELDVLTFYKKYYKEDINQHQLIDELKDITKLDLNGKGIEKLPLDVFDTLVNLESLDLHNNNLTEIHPNTFANNINLRTLDLYYNRLTVIDPSTFVNNVNLQTLKIYGNRLTVIDPSTFVNNTNLRSLVLSDNKLTEIHPNTFVNNIDLRYLSLYNTNLTVIEPNTFDKLVNLESLYLYKNKLTEIHPNTFVNNFNLHTLYISENKLTEIHPNTFVNNIDLHILELCKNNITALPLEIIYLRNLRYFNCNNNPIENIHLVIIRFLNRLQNRELQRGIYTDNQSVHNHAIQESVRNSVINILKDKTEHLDWSNSILNDDILTPITKTLLLEYCQDTTEHSSLLITFEDLLKQVWNRILKHPEGVELKRILNQEIQDSECKCFTGRLSRLVNVLNGYFDDVNITIQTSDQLSNVIIAIKEMLEREGNYTVEKHRELAINELKERGYEEDIIKMWVDEI